MTLKAGLLPMVGREKIHPAIHIDEHGVIVGRVTEMGEYQLVSSDRQVFAPAEVKDVLRFQPRPYTDLGGRWADSDVEAFLADGQAPFFSEVLARIIATLDTKFEFPRSEHRALVATWILATYFSPSLLAFPRLSFSGERETGKSKLMTLLRAMAWNALLTLNPTPAVLFRLVHEFRPTLLLDEAEGMSREDARDVLAIVNSGYKAGGVVPRVEGKEQKRVECFEVYSPLALAAIRSLNPTTEDRCLSLVLQRGGDPRRINTEVDLHDQAFAAIRAGCYRLLLTKWSTLRDASEGMDLPRWLNGRARELWKPLITLAMVADQEDGLALTPDLLALARDHVADRTGVSTEAEALLAVLADQLRGDPFVRVRPRDLTEELRKRLGWRDGPTPEAVGSWLRRLGLRRAGRDRDGAWYEVTADWLTAVTARYSPDQTVTPSPSHAK